MEFDYKLLKVDRCSNRACADLMYAILNTGAEVSRVHVFDHRAMLVMGSWTSADILVKIPRRMVDSNVHKTNLDFFTLIKGVSVCEPPAEPVVD